MKLGAVVNDQAVSHEVLVGKYFPRASGFSQTNLRKKQKQKDAISAGPILHFLLYPTTHLSPTIEAPP